MVQGMQLPKDILEDHCIVRLRKGVLPCPLLANDGAGFAGPCRVDGWRKEWCVRTTGIMGVIVVANCMYNLNE